MKLRYRYAGSDGQPTTQLNYTISMKHITNSNNTT